MDVSAHNFESHPRSVAAIVLPNLGEAYNSLDYIKGVSAVIGTDHIYSISESVNSVQIVLKSAEYVNPLIENGIRVKGRFVPVDYAIPPGIKVLLIDDDSNISNDEIMQELSKYCWIKSPIIHLTEFDEVEYSHIKNGKRKVYVELVQGCEIPSELKLLHNGTYHQIRVIINENSETNSQTSSNNTMIHDDDSSHIVLIKQEILEIENPEETTGDEYLNITNNEEISAARTLCQIQDYASCAADTKPTSASHILYQISEISAAHTLCQMPEISAAHTLCQISAAHTLCQVQNYASCAAVHTDTKHKSKRMAERPQDTSKNCEMLRQSASNLLSDNGSFDDKIKNFLETVKFRRNVKELADRAVAQGDFKSLSHLLDELASYSMHCSLHISMRINRIVQKLLDSEEESASAPKNR